MASPSPAHKRQGRYEIRKLLAEGGMSRVWVAFDPTVKREVAFKTIRDVQDKTLMDLFELECQTLARLGHPNIVEIFDTGVTDDGEPFLVMPLLKGVTLDKLISASSTRLTVDRSVQIISQVCRGLQAAHDQKLIHRDLKPSNLFVLEDDSVKIIDFGVAHLTDQGTSTGLKGTLLYMSPEQVQSKKLEPWSDQFSLAVITYEALTRRHPFASSGMEDLAQAIIKHQPPPASDINNLIPPGVSQVVHKALAKDPFHRFATVREYAECLQKALRGEAIEIFDPLKIEPRLVRARQAFDEGDLDYAAEIIRQLKSESYLNAEINQLDAKIENLIRDRSVKQLLETAKRRFDEKEFKLALQKVQEALNFDPQNIDAHTLKAGIDTKWGSAQAEEWFGLAQQHLENKAFKHARQQLEKLLDVRPNDLRAEALLVEINRREQEFNRIRREIEQTHQDALAAWERGEVKSALSKAEKVLELDRRAPHLTSPDLTPAYEKFYQQVRSKSEELKSQADTAKKHIEDGNIQEAFAICDRVLAKSPNDQTFRLIREDAEQKQRQEIFSYLAHVEKEVAKEPDFARRVALLTEARAKYPTELRFEQSLQQATARKNYLDSIVERARAHEEVAQFSEALTQWESLREIHSQHPGLDIEVQRVRRRREDQVKAEAKSTWITQIDQANSAHHHSKALSLISEAVLEFPGDPELVTLEKFAHTFLDRQKEAQQKLAQGKELEVSGKTEEALDVIRGAAKIDPRNPDVRGALIDLLLKQAQTLFDKDWRLADPLVKEALELESTNLLGKSLRTHIQDRSQTEVVVQFLSKAREFQAELKLREAVSELDKGLDKYPKESRLIQLRTVLEQTMSTAERLDLRNRDLQDVKRLAEESQHSSDVSQLASVFERTRVYGKYQNDPDFRDPMSAIEQRYEKKKPKPTPEIVESVALQLARPAETPPRRVIRVQPFDNKKAWAIGGAATLATLFLMGILFRKDPPPPPPPPKEPVHVALHLNKMDSRDPKISVLDANGVDVISSMASPGLHTGKYTVAATLRGFQKLENTFDVQDGEKPKTIDLKMVPLPTKLVVRRTWNSELKLENEILKVDPSGNSETELKEGLNKISWKRALESLDITLLVKDGRVEVQDVMPKSYSVLITRIDANAASTEGSANFQRVSVVGGTPRSDSGHLDGVDVDQGFALQVPGYSQFVFPPLPAELSSIVYVDLSPPLIRPNPPPKKIAAPPDEEWREEQRRIAEQKRIEEEKQIAEKKRLEKLKEEADKLFHRSSGGNKQQ